MPRDTDFNISDDPNDNGEGGHVEIYDDGNGGFTDADGNPVDANGVLIEEDRGDDHVDTDVDGGAGGDALVTEDDALDPDVLDELAGGKSRTVPIGRLNEALEQNKQLLAILQNLTPAERNAVAAAAAPAEAAKPAFDLSAKLKERNSKLADGDEDGALALDLEIEEYRLDTATTRAQAHAIKAVTEANEANSVNAVIEKAFTEYPFLEEDTETLDEVMMYRDHYFRKGVTLSVALSQAVAKVCPAKAKELGYEVDDGSAGTVAKPAKVLPKVLSLADRRKANAVARNLKVEQQQPPRVNAQGTPNKASPNADTIDWANITDAEFDALPAEVKAKARGDAG